MQVLSVYCDGSSSGRANKPGGWGFVLVIDDIPVAAGCGGDPKSTNNVMELTGAIKGLECVIGKRWHLLFDVELVCDSRYVLGIASKKYHASKNVQLAIQLQKLVNVVQCKKFRWVKGHSNDIWNSRCDNLAKHGREQISGRETADPAGSDSGSNPNFG